MYTLPPTHTHICTVSHTHIPLGHKKYTRLQTPPSAPVGMVWLKRPTLPVCNTLQYTKNLCIASLSPIIFLCHSHPHTYTTIPFIPSPNSSSISHSYSMVGLSCSQTVFHPYSVLISPAISLSISVSSLLQHPSSIQAFLLPSSSLIPLHTSWS